MYIGCTHWWNEVKCMMQRRRKSGAASSELSRPPSLPSLVQTRHCSLETLSSHQKVFTFRLFCIIKVLSHPPHYSTYAEKLVSKHCKSANMAWHHNIELFFGLFIFVEIRKSSRETMQAFCECGFVQTPCNKWSLHLNIYTFKPGLKTFLDKILWYVLSLVCLKIAETIPKSIIYVRKLLKVILSEYGNVCWHRHLAGISATLVIRGFRTVEKCS